MLSNSALVILVIRIDSFNSYLCIWSMKSWATWLLKTPCVHFHSRMGVFYYLVNLGQSLKFIQLNLYNLHLTWNFVNYIYLSFLIRYTHTRPHIEQYLTIMQNFMEWIVIPWNIQYYERWNIQIISK